MFQTESGGPAGREWYPVSDAWTTRGRLSDARVMSRADVVPPSSEGSTTYPRFVRRASGAHVWDVDGRRYVDFLLGYGPVVLGHADDRVNDAVMYELRQGNCFAPLWSPRQVELTELLTSVIPGAESALLLKTGSDATSAAVRLARIHTGRTKVARWGYNGWHDWSVEQDAGVPASVRSETLLFDYGDLEGLEQLFEQHPREIACVLMMPFENHLAPAGHLDAIRSLCHRHGALFVLDEMRSGFRMAVGGAQSALDVRADLVTLSKAMANGYAVSAVTGPRSVMEGLALTKISSTFFANPADMAAAICTIGILRETDALSRVWYVGRLLQEGLEEVFAALDIDAAIVGYPPMPFVEFNFDDSATRKVFVREFFRATTEEGLLLHPNHQWFVSASHTEADVTHALEACSRAGRRALDTIAHRHTGCGR